MIKTLVIRKTSRDPAVVPKNDAPSEVPLCVDLDGTLVRTDTLLESSLVLVKQRPWNLLWMLTWLSKGKAGFKREIARRVDLPVDLLPYQTDFVDYLHRQKAAGRRLILVTAADDKIARKVARHLDLFDDVLASHDGINLRGRTKLKALQARYGNRGFDYAGNDRTDLKIWPHARKALVVNAPASLQSAARDVAPGAQFFWTRPSRLRALMRAVRMHQWLKNLLLFVPLIMSHRFGEPHLVMAAGIGFLAFSLCAAGVYLLNDLLDLSADRGHAHKRLRPFAAGDLSLLTGLAAVPLLMAAGFALSLTLHPLFSLLLAVYVLSSFLYSIQLKTLPVVDVLVLSGLYTLRLIAGGAATSTRISFWLLAFAMFIFFSLAIVKRYSELAPLSEAGKLKRIAGRGYWTHDLETLRVLGICSGYLAVLVMALYINSVQVRILYRHPYMLWALCPLILYWISRVWLLAGRGEMHEDPIVFALHDVTSLAVGVLALIFVLLAI